MSTFKTSIPVDLAAVKKLLPPMSHVESITLDVTQDPPAVILQWSNQRCRTPYSVALDWPLSDLQAQKEPALVKVEDWPPKLVAKPAQAAPAPYPAPQPKICNRCGIVSPPTHFDNNLNFCSAKCHREHLDEKLAKVGTTPEPDGYATALHKYVEKIANKGSSPAAMIARRGRSKPQKVVDNTPEKVQ